MPRTSDRTAIFTESVIRRMTRVANQHDAINLSQGFPDFDPPSALVAALADSPARAPTSMPSPGGRPISGRRWPPSSPGSWASARTRIGIWS